MKDYVYYNDLFEIYGDLLTEKERENFKDYYFEDLTLSEIADNKNVSRAAIQKMIKNVLDKLNYYESKLHVYEKNKMLSDIIKKVSNDELKDRLNKILEL